MEDKDLIGHQPQPVPIMLMAQPVDVDEVKLIDLWRVLMRRKGITLGIAAVSVTIALVYALVATPIYKVEAWLLPPTEANLDGLASINELPSLRGKDSSLPVRTPKKVYASLVQNLMSISLRRHFFDEHKLASVLNPAAATTDPESGFKTFDRALTVTKKGAHVMVAFEGSNAALAAKWVNEFVAEVNAATVKSLVDDANNGIRNNENVLRDAILAKRKMAQQIREDKIASLEDAEQLAQSLGIKNDLITSGKTMMTDPPLYMMGTRVLKLQIKLLRQRKGDGPYVGNLRGLQEKLAILEGIQLDPSHISAVQVDQPAIVPKYHIKPHRRVIVTIGLTVGLMLGVFAAFFVEFLAKIKEEGASA